MRRVFVWGMIGFLGAVVGFTPLAAWAGWGEQSAPRKDLSPEQKAQLEQQLKKSAQAYASLTAQQKQEMLTQLADSINQTGSLRPEQKAMLKANYQKLLGV